MWNVNRFDILLLTFSNNNQIDRFRWPVTGHRSKITFNYLYEFRWWSMFRVWLHPAFWMLFSNTFSWGCYSKGCWNWWQSYNRSDNYFNPAWLEPNTISSNSASWFSQDNYGSQLFPNQTNVSLVNSSQMLLKNQLNRNKWSFLFLFDNNRKSNTWRRWKRSKLKTHVLSIEIKLRFFSHFEPKTICVCVVGMVKRLYRENVRNDHLYYFNHKIPDLRCAGGFGLIWKPIRRIKDFEQDTKGRGKR